MGKASKWMMNFLLGRKEEKNRKKDNLFLEENEKISTGIFSSSPIIKRRWSFGRSSSKGISHKSSKSLDLNTTTPVNQTHELVTLKNRPSNANTLASALAATTAPVATAVAPKPATDGIISKELAEAAATKIQAVFRSYLARKALGALRGLVKLQALVRGHLVRKQTTTTLRRMHALMTIQVRARFQRIQMAAKESELVVETKSSRYRNIPQETESRRAQREAIDTNLQETHGISKGKSAYVNSSKIGRIEHGVTKYYSGELSISKQQHYHYEEFSFSSAQNTPRHYHETCNIIPGRASYSYQQQTEYAPPEPHDHSFLPNYMANTESSKAKVRSQSEPKQRPERSMRTEGKQMASIDGAQHCSPCSKQAIRGNQESWFIKLYRSKKILKESENHSNTSTSHSNYCNSLAPYEPYMTLY